MLDNLFDTASSEENENEDNELKKKLKNLKRI
jgi:hypothetical protein